MDLTRKPKWLSSFRDATTWSPVDPAVEVGTQLTSEHFVITIIVNIIV